MWEMSAMPTAERIARCSWMIEVYWTGMAQPAKSTIRPPWETCQSYRGVRKSGASMAKLRSRESGRSSRRETPAEKTAILAGRRRFDQGLARLGLRSRKRLVGRKA